MSCSSKHYGAELDKLLVYLEKDMEMPCGGWDSVSNIESRQKCVRYFLGRIVDTIRDARRKENLDMVFVPTEHYETVMQFVDSLNGVGVVSDAGASFKTCGLGQCCINTLQDIHNRGELMRIQGSRARCDRCGWWNMILLDGIWRLAEVEGGSR